MRTGWLILTLAACYAPSAPQGAPCSATLECPSGQTCYVGVCSTEPFARDAAVDSTLTDSPGADANSPDGAVDAAVNDAATATDPWGAIAGLVARYPMDDNPAATGRVSSSDPTAEGSCPASECPTAVVGVNGGGYSFNGDQRAVISRSSLITSAPYTVSLWAWFDPATPPYAHILSKPEGENTNRNMFGFGLNAGRLAWESSDGGYVQLVAPSTLDPFNGWHHYALEWNGSRKRLYIDGEPTTSQLTTMVDSTLPFSLGADVDFGIPDGYIVARVDELRIYHRALDPGEIQGLATSSGL